MQTHHMPTITHTTSLCRAVVSSAFGHRRSFETTYLRTLAEHFPDEWNVRWTQAFSNVQSSCQQMNQTASNASTLVLTASMHSSCTACVPTSWCPSLPLLRRPPSHGGGQVTEHTPTQGHTQTRLALLVVNGRKSGETVSGCANGHKPELIAHAWRPVTAVATCPRKLAKHLRQVQVWNRTAGVLLPVVLQRSRSYVCSLKARRVA